MKFTKSSTDIWELLKLLVGSSASPTQHPKSQLSHTGIRNVSHKSS